MQKGDHRVTVSILRSGQPRPYADTERVVRLMFEFVPWVAEKGAELKHMPWRVTEAEARRAADGLMCGYRATTRGEAGFLESYLDYFRTDEPQIIKHVGGGERLDEVRAAVWEFRVVDPFTD